MKHHERREQIIHLLRERAERGLTYKALSEESGIPIPTLAGWASRLKREMVVAQPAAGLSPFLEVGVRGMVPSTSRPAPLELEVFGCVIRLGDDFDEAVLARLLAVLRASAAC